MDGDGMREVMRNLHVEDDDRDGEGDDNDR